MRSNKIFEEIIKGIALTIAVILILWSVKLLGTVVALGAQESELTKPCGLTEEELASRLLYELPQYAGDFLAAEEKHGVNACFLAAIASLESGHGRYCFKPNNIFGWSGKSFESVPECIDYVAEKLATNYLDPEGKYYRGGTIADIGKVYCPGREEWVTKVTGIYEKLLEKDTETLEKSIEKVDVIDKTVCLEELKSEESQVVIIFVIIKGVE